MLISSDNIMFFIFILEVIIVIILLIVILVSKALIGYSNRNAARLYKKLSEQLASSLAHGTPFNPKFNKYSYYSLTTLLAVVESFDHRFKGGEWHELKNEISRKYLINKARSWSKSLFWVKRNFSARVFAITSYPEDETTVIKLMDDKVFLVSSIASIVAVKIELRDGIYKILKKMTASNGYSYYLFRDLLLTGSEKILLWIEEFAVQDESPAFHIACLDILEDSYLPLSKLSLEKDFYSNNPKIRLAACKIYSNNPQHDSPQKLIEASKDSDITIRAEAIQALSQFYSPKTIAALEKCLLDEDLHVRIQAALTLSKLGEEGIQTLKTQNPTTNVNAYEAAQYALQFNEGL
jgi:HEAT repeats